MSRRLPKSLSDLDGTDPLSHDGTVRGVFRELSNALVKRRNQPGTSSHEQDLSAHQDGFAAHHEIRRR
jgi:hypothetical protein